MQGSTPQTGYRSAWNAAPPIRSVGCGQPCALSPNDATIDGLIALAMAAEQHKAAPKVVGWI